MRPLIIDSFAGGGGASEGIRAAIGRLILGHLPSLLCDALLPETLRFGARLYVGRGHPQALKQIGLAAPRGNALQDRPFRLRAWLGLRVRHRDGPPISLQRALRRSLFREAKLRCNPSTSRGTA